MRIPLVILSLVFATNTLAQGAAVPHQFSNGNAIVASEFNANFQELADRNHELQNQVVLLEADVLELRTASKSDLLQFVGNSTGATNGGQGVRFMTELCQADYPSSRICTTEEYTKTVDFPGAIAASEFAWLAPEKLVAPSNSSDLIDTYSGTLTNPNSVNCNGWLAAQISRGTTVSGTGQFNARTCDAILKVSCCK